MGELLFIEHNSLHGGTPLFLLDLLNCLPPRWRPIVCLPSEALFRPQFEAASIPLLKDWQWITFESWRSRRWLSRWPLVRGRATIISLFKLVFYTLPMIIRFCRLFQRLQPALIHVNDTIYMNRAEIIAAWLASYPVVAHITNINPFSWIDRLVARIPKAFLASSEAIKANYVRYRVPEERIHVFYDGVDLKRFRPVEDRRALRLRLGLPVGDVLVLSAGRLIEWKGHHILAQALQPLAAEGYRFRWLVLGEGAMRLTLEAMIMEMGLAERTIFLGYRTNIEDYLAASDIIVQPSIRPEPLGRIVVEAMASAKSVIATNSGGLPELIDDGATGLLVPAGDVVAIGKALRQLLNDSQLCHKLGAAAEKKIRTQADLRMQVEKIAAVYDQVEELHREVCKQATRTLKT